MSKPSFELLSVSYGREEARGVRDDPGRVLHRQEALHLPSTEIPIRKLQADTAHIMVPEDGSFTTVSAVDDRKAGEIQGRRLNSSSRYRSPSGE